MNKNRCYAPEDLKRTQDVLLDILKEVNRVCDENNITLFMEGGTAIGTVRHGGFIPWDDDIDVFALREDYDRLMEILPQQLSDGYGMDNWLNNADFPAPNACVYAKNTISVPVEMKNCKYKYGISIGIYPYDNIPDDDDAAKRQLRKCWFWCRLHWLKVLPFPYVPYKGLKRFIIHTVCGVGHIFLKLVPKKFIVTNYENACRENNGIETRRATIASSTPIFRTTVVKEELFPAVVMPFEDTQVKLPACYDSLLTREYGDYMQLPPEDKRKNHFPCVLKFAEDTTD